MTFNFVLRLLGYVVIAGAVGWTAGGFLREAGVDWPRAIVTLCFIAFVSAAGLGLFRVSDEAGPVSSVKDMRARTVTRVLFPSSDRHGPDDRSS